MLGQRLRRWPNIEQHWRNVQCLRESPPAQQTQTICIAFIQSRHNVFDVGLTLYKVIQMFCVHWVSVQAGVKQFRDTHSNTVSLFAKQGPAKIQD